MIFQTENLLKENGDKLPADVKGEIESALNTLKEAHKSQDVAAIDAASETLNKGDGEILCPSAGCTTGRARLRTGCGRTTGCPKPARSKTARKISKMLTSKK